MTDPTIGAQPNVTVEHRMHQLVGVQRALHQRLDPPLARQSHALFGRGMAVFGGNQLEFGDVDRRFGRCLPDARLRTDQDGPDEASAGRQKRTAQGRRIHRVHHGATDRLAAQRASALDHGKHEITGFAQVRPALHARVRRRCFLGGGGRAVIHGLASSR